MRLAQSATRNAPPHWEQLDTTNRKTVKDLLSLGYEVRTAFTDSYSLEIAYLEKGNSLYRCVIGGGSLNLLAKNELLCSEFIEPYRTK